MSELLSEIERVVGPELTKEGVELVDLTYQKGPAGWTLCFFIDKPGGVSLDDCASWSNRFGQILDQTELISHAYALEVSSPGLERPLKKPADFTKFAGERVSIKLYAPLNGQKNFHGVLLGLEGDSLKLRLEDKNEVGISLSQVAKAKLDPVIEF